MGVGKEANELEDVQAGLVHNWDEVRSLFRRSEHSDWLAVVVPVLTRARAAWLSKQTGLALSTIKAARNGHTVPHGDNRAALTKAAGEFARAELTLRRGAPPLDDLAACRLLLA